MKKIDGTSNKYLEVNLTDLSYEVFQATAEDRAAYIGGKGLGLKYYYDRVEDLAGVDPLGEENLICFMMGVVVGTAAPCSGRFDAVTKAPLTGIMVTSSCGGPFGVACKTAGWDGVIVKGKASRPTTMVIGTEGVTFEDASELWGLDTHETQEKLGMCVKDGACVIGPAGENLVNYANVCSGHRFLGRGGIGAVMGSKNLKAIVAQGRDYVIEPAIPEMFEKTRKKEIKFIKRNGFSKKYKDFGTNSGVRPGITAGYAPVYNFRDRTDPRVENVSGEAMAERYNTKSSTCKPCSVLCGHCGTYPDGKKYQIPEYETIGLFGPNIGNFDPDKIGYWNHTINLMGMDTISLGGTFSWAMEAREKGIYESDLAFDSFENIEEIIRDVAHRRGQGEELANGSRWLSEKYGGKDFACQVKGMEMAAYDPRGAWGQGLTYAVTNRGGCHLGSYLVAPEVMFGFLKPYTTLAKGKWAVFFEDIFAGINCLHTCQFTGFAAILEPPIAKYTPLPILKIAMQYMPSVAMMMMDWSIFSRLFWSITGQKMTMYEFKKAGARTQILERYMNTLMGISKKDDTLPGRFLNEADTKHKVKKTVKLEPMVRDYYKVRGYDADGRPKAKTLAKYGIKPRNVKVPESVRRPMPVL